MYKTYKLHKYGVHRSEELETEVLWGRRKETLQLEPVAWWTVNKAMGSLILTCSQSATRHKQIFSKRIWEQLPGTLQVDHYLNKIVKYTRFTVDIIIIQGAFSLDQTMRSVLHQTAVSGQLMSSTNG